MHKLNSILFQLLRFYHHPDNTLVVTRQVEVINQLLIFEFPILVPRLVFSKVLRLEGGQLPKEVALFFQLATLVKFEPFIMGFTTEQLTNVYIAGGPIAREIGLNAILSMKA